jgi:hypothetical protein
MSSTLASFINALTKTFVDNLRNFWNGGKEFIKLNPLYAPLFLMGIKCVISNIWAIIVEVNENVHTVNISSLRKKYRGDWAFIADVSKTYGATCATLLAGNGYNILTLTPPDSSLYEEIKLKERSLEVIKVSPFCSQFDPQDILKIEEALNEKTIGIIIMNLFYESPCNFAKEFPIAIIGSINACIIKTTLFNEILIKHIKGQQGKAALLTTGSLLADTAWPGFQVSSGCAKSIEELTANIKELDAVHIKSGYVPIPLKNSFYSISKKVEAKKSLMKIGVYKKAFAHYRMRMQMIFHSSKWGKPNRFAYGRLGLLQRYLG